MKKDYKFWLLKKWNDPVWSKVISVGIVGIITIVFNFFFSLIYQKTFKNAFLTIWTSKIELWIVIFVFLSVQGVLYLYRNKFRYNEDTLKQDRLLFNNIRFENFMQDFFLEIKGRGFSSHPICSERISTLIDFLEDSKRSDFEFFHPTLEKLKKRLIDEFQNFDTVISKYVFGTDIKGPKMFVSIPTEWELEQPERLKKARKEIAMQEDKLTETFQMFITKGRRILSV